MERKRDRDVSPQRTRWCVDVGGIGFLRWSIETFEKGSQACAKCFGYFLEGQMPLTLKLGMFTQGTRSMVKNESEK